MEPLVITVSQLNRYAHALISENERLGALFVKGELSNIRTPSAGGHLYFTLKDETGAVRAVMFKNAVQNLKFLPENGMAVLCRGRADIYERDGQFRLCVNEMLPAGAGEAALAFRRTKEKLEAEGLFRPEDKRPVSPLPGTVAVVTSDTGAAVQDILRVLQRRNPMVRVLLCPVTVQGSGAAAGMVEMLERVYLREDVDTIIIGRGGGSAEDLACFNDETLARTVRRSPVPVISAVGHETDFTICDFAADLRAPTPSAAAELAAADFSALRTAVQSARRRLDFACDACIRKKEDRFRYASEKHFRRGEEILGELSGRLERLQTRLAAAGTGRVDTESGRLAELTAKLGALSPSATFARGYAAVLRGDRWITDAADLAPGDTVSVRLAFGSFDAVVRSTHRDTPIPEIPSQT